MTARKMDYARFLCELVGVEESAGVPLGARGNAEVYFAAMQLAAGLHHFCVSSVMVTLNVLIYRDYCASGLRASK